MQAAHGAIKNDARRPGETNRSAHARFFARIAQYTGPVPRHPMPNMLDLDVPEAVRVPMDVQEYMPRLPGVPRVLPGVPMSITTAFAVTDEDDKIACYPLGDVVIIAVSAHAENSDFAPATYEGPASHKSQRGELTLAAHHVVAINANGRLLLDARIRGERGAS